MVLSPFSLNSSKKLEQSLIIKELLSWNWKLNQDFSLIREYEEKTSFQCQTYVSKRFVIYRLVKENIFSNTETGFYKQQGCIWKTNEELPGITESKWYDQNKGK